MYFERQAGSNCRFHTIANAIDRKVSKGEKDKLISQFEFLYDVKESVQKGFTTVSCTREIFVSFSIRKLIGFSGLHLPKQVAKDEMVFFSVSKLLENCEIIVVYDGGHVWTLKKYNSQWFNKNSNLPKPQKIDIRSFLKSRHGFIFFYSKRPNQALFNKVKEYLKHKRIDHSLKLNLLLNAVLLTLQFSNDQKKKKIFAKLVKKYSKKPSIQNARLVVANFINFI